MFTVGAVNQAPKKRKIPYYLPQNKELSLIAKGFDESSPYRKYKGGNYEKIYSPINSN